MIIHYLSVSVSIGAGTRLNPVKSCHFTALPRFSSPQLFQWWSPLFAKTHLLRLCTANASNSIHNSPDFDKTAEEEGSTGKDEDHGATSANQILTRLKRYGISGVLSYGLLNTAYYLPTFLVVWFYVSPAPGRMGYLAAVKRFLKVMAMVWAGSQVTKLVRAGGALALAPIVDRGLSWFTVKFKFESQEKCPFCRHLWSLLDFVSGWPS
ncbi:uncharacterized protein [Henckelia pumila]|uniref:uncharacterized protein isoform X2 n=1 Tax=Henckelia pumila TaxID=405737 RepID=UPI003C6E6660